MASSRYTFMLDLHSKYSQIALPVTAGDTDRELCISFSDGGKPFILTENHIAKISIEYPTKNTIEAVCVVSEDGSYLKYEFDDLTCPVSGLYDCQIVIYRSDKKIAAPKFTLEADGRINTDGSTDNIPEGDLIILDGIYRAEAQRQENENARREAEEKREVAEKGRVQSTKNAIDAVNEVKDSIVKMRDDGSFDGSDGFSPLVNVYEIEDGYGVTITDKDGTRSFTIKNGKTGDPGISAFHEWNGTVLIMRSAAGTSAANLKGEKGDKGDRGDGIDIVRTFTSVAQMLTSWETDGVPVGKFVLISTGNVNDEDNAKLYVKTENGYLYLSDLSGAQGIRGEKGEQGDKGDKGDDYVLTEADKKDIADIAHEEILNDDDIVKSMSYADKKDWEDTSYIPDDWIEREVTFTIDVEAAKAAGYGGVLENITNQSQLTFTKPKGVGFVYDFNDKHSYRVYTELSKGRGIYNKIVTSASGAPIFDPDGYDWVWSEYVDGTKKPANGAIPLYPTNKMNSIVLRQNNGDIAVPYIPFWGASAASKYYVDEKKTEVLEYADEKNEEQKLFVNEELAKKAGAVAGTKSGSLIVVDDIDPTASTVVVHSPSGGVTFKVGGSNFSTADTVTAKGSTGWHCETIYVYPPKGHKYVLSCDFKRIEGTKVGIAVKPDDNSRDWYREIGSTAAEGSLSVEVEAGEYKKWTSLKFYSNYTGSAIATECIFSNIVFRLADMDVEPGTKGIEPISYTTDALGDKIITIPPDIRPVLVYNLDDVELSATYNKDLSKVFTTVECVTKLPTANINPNKIYNLFSATFIHNRHVVDNSKCYIVDNRPTVGEPATNLERNAITAYYDLSDGKVYGYLDETLAAGFSQLSGTTIVAGWYLAEQLLPIAGWSYAGVIDHIGEDPNDSTIRLLLEKRVYIYQNEWIEFTNSIVEERLPTPDSNGHFAYTVQRRDGVDAYELHLISHAINDAYANQIPLRVNGKIKTGYPIDNLDAANKQYVDNLVSTIPKFNISVVSSLPTSNISGTTVYIIPKASSTTTDIYDEYIYVNNKWELLGTAKIDLSNYLKKSEAFSGDYNDLTNKPFPQSPTFKTLTESSSATAQLTKGWWYFKISIGGGVEYGLGSHYYNENTSLRLSCIDNTGAAYCIAVSPYGFSVYKDGTQFSASQVTLKACKVA